jgi:hypothetical protein
VLPAKQRWKAGGKQFRDVACQPDHDGDAAGRFYPFVSEHLQALMGAADSAAAVCR